MTGVPVRLYEPAVGFGPFRRSPWPSQHVHSADMFRLLLHRGVDWDNVQATPIRGRVPRSVA